MPAQDFHKSWLKGSYDYVISTADYFLDQSNPSNTTSMEEVCKAKGRLCCEIDLILSHSLRESLSANERFSLLLHLDIMAYCRVSNMIPSFISVVLCVIAAIPFFRKRTYFSYKSYIPVKGESGLKFPFTLVNIIAFNSEIF